MNLISRRALVIMSTAALLYAPPSIVNAQQIFESRRDAPAALVELYTSEGCSSCPPAEEWLNSLKASPDLWTKWIPLAFHVDYWNGLGWPDRFAQKGFTDRQRQYASRTASGSVYTPEFIVNDIEWRGWFRREHLPAVKNKSTTAWLRLALTPAGQAQVSGALPKDTTYKLSLALLGFDLTSQVRRGENSGRTLRHDFVVLYLNEQRPGSGASLNTVFELPAATLSQSGALALWAVDAQTSEPITSLGGWLQR